MDIINPLDKKIRQPIPSKTKKYENKLAFRLRYDDQSVERMKGLVMQQLDNMQKSNSSDDRRQIQNSIWKGIESNTYISKEAKLRKCLGMNAYNES